MTKKIHLVVIPLSILLLSGCKRSKTGRSRPEKTVDQVRPEENRISIFDEHEQAFVLEDTVNPFTPEGGTPLATGDSLWIPEQKVAFETVYFGFDQYKITPAQQMVLDRIVKAIPPAIQEGNKLIVIEGHACNSAGSPRYNTMLSEQRAQEVRKYFIAQGIPAEQLRVVGRGSEMRKVLTGNREQQAPNRRVEFYIVQESEQASE